MKATVVKRTSLDSAHYLPNYVGKCRSLHGHHWVVEVGVTGEIAPDGMVLDFKLLSEFLRGVEAQFDHSLINRVIEIPTAENIALYIRDRFYSWADALEVTLEFVRIWETEDSYVEVKGEKEEL